MPLLLPPTSFPLPWELPLWSGTCSEVKAGEEELAGEEKCFPLKGAIGIRSPHFSTSSKFGLPHTHQVRHARTVLGYSSPRASAPGSFTETYLPGKAAPDLEANLIMVGLCPYFRLWAYDASLV